MNMQTPLPKRLNLYQLVVHVAIVFLAIEVVVLAKQNRELKETQDFTKLEPLKAGDVFELSGLRGASPIETFPDHPQYQIIFVFTTSCPFCTQNISAWRQIEEKGLNEGIPVIGISLDGRDKTFEYAKLHSLTYPIFFPGEAKSFERRNRIKGVPRTIFRGPNGKVEKIWNGRLSESDVEEVRDSISRYKSVAGVNTHNQRRDKP
jgi:peroxiredoxin